MNETITQDMRAVYDRLTKIETRGEDRDRQLARIEAVLSDVAGRLDGVAGDVRDAKTALRVGFWISTTIVPAGAAVVGWFTHAFWPGK